MWTSQNQVMAPLFENCQALRQKKSAWLLKLSNSRVKFLSWRMKPYETPIKSASASRENPKEERRFCKTKLVIRYGKLLIFVLKIYFQSRREKSTTSQNFEVSRTKLRTSYALSSVSPCVTRLRQSMICACEVRNWGLRVRRNRSSRTFSHNPSRSAIWLVIMLLSGDITNTETVSGIRSRAATENIVKIMDFPNLLAKLPKRRFLQVGCTKPFPVWPLKRSFSP